MITTKIHTCPILCRRFCDCALVAMTTAPSNPASSSPHQILQQWLLGHVSYPCSRLRVTPSPWQPRFTPSSWQHGAPTPDWQLVFVSVLWLDDWSVCPAVSHGLTSLCKICGWVGAPSSFCRSLLSSDPAWPSGFCLTCKKRNHWCLQ